MNQQGFSKKFQEYRRKLRDLQIQPKANLDWMYPGHTDFDAAVTALKKVISGAEMMITVSTKTIACGVEVLAEVIGFDLVRDGRTFWLPPLRKSRKKK